MKRMREKVKLHPLVAGVVAVGAVILAGIGLSKMKATPVEKMAAHETKARKAYTNMMNGCVSKALKDEKLAMVVILTQGQVCNQVVGDMVNKEVNGEGYCDMDQECMFKLGYVKTAIVTSSVDLTSEEVAILEEEAAISFKELEETQGQ